MSYEGTGDTGAADARRAPLLFSGIVAGVGFFAVSTVEMVLRPGFDIARHAISMLSLGERGWLMVATFIVSGMLVIACATGMRRAGGGWAAPVLVGIYGIGLVLAGLFPAPAGLGFPPGTPPDQQPAMTPSAIVHSIAFMLAFSSLIVASLVVSLGRVRTNPVIAAYSAATAIGLPLLIGLGMAQMLVTGIAFYAAAMLGWLWLGIVCATMMRDARS